MRLILVIDAMQLDTELSLNRDRDSQKRSIRGRSGDHGRRYGPCVGLLGPRAADSAADLHPAQVWPSSAKDSTKHKWSWLFTFNDTKRFFLLLLFCRNGREKRSSTPAEIRGVETLRLGCTEKDQAQEMWLLSGLRGIDLNDAYSPASGSWDRHVCFVDSCKQKTRH